MGLFSKIVTHAIVEIAEAMESEHIAEDAKEQKKSKTYPFRSWQEFVEFSCAFFFFSQTFYVMALLCIQADNMSVGIFYQSCAMAALVSIALFFLGLLAYGMYRVDMLPLLLLILPLPLCVTMSIGFTHGFGVLGDFFTGVWMNSAIKLIFFLLGILSTASTFSGVLYYESRDSKQQIRKQEKPKISDEEAEMNRNILRSAIQENAVNVRFIKRKWNFSTSSDVMFGYDVQNKQFAFVSDINSYTLSSTKIVYLDFEDVKNDPDVKNCTNIYQRLIKLYYLGSGEKENVLYLSQAFSDDKSINRIKHFANNAPTSNAEIVFRRKIRFLASTLQMESYPCRPFRKDEWFEQLQECMEKIKNNNTDGYSLFKSNVISSDNYMDNEILKSIICDFSLDPPDKTRAKKEAKKLCRQAFNATLKASVKNFFSS